MNSEKWEITLLDEHENPTAVFEFYTSAQARETAQNYVMRGYDFKVTYRKYESEE